MTDYATKLWSQLCLDASLTVNDSNILHISLSAQSLSNADVKPPRGTPTTCIESIGLSFHFSTCRRTRNALSAPITVSGNDIQHTRTLTESIDDHLDHGYHSPLPSLRGPQNTMIDSCTPFTSTTLLVGASPVNHNNSVIANTHIFTLDSSATRYKYATQEVKNEILVQMVDSSIRRMMSDNKSVRPGGIILSSDPGCPKLAAISPALFSPGYLKVQLIITSRDTAECLIPGGFTAYCSTAHDSTNCVPSTSPHDFQWPERQTQAITRRTDYQLFGL